MDVAEDMVIVEDFKAIIFVDTPVAAVVVMDVVDSRVETETTGNQRMIQINIAGIVKLLVMIFMYAASMQGSRRRILVM
jgi:hypothetical protein